MEYIISKNVNREQIVVIAGVVEGSHRKYFCTTNLVMMLQNNFKKNISMSKYDGLALMFTSSAQVIQSTKKCNHRNQNGWCNKGNRSCPFFKSLLINQ